MLWAGLTVPPAFADVTYTVMEFGQLDAWETDDHAAALATFLNTCRDMEDVDWRNLCSFAEANPDPRQFFELFFRPVLIEDGQDAMFTGYFEPELDGDLYPSSRFQYPIYSMPKEAKANNPWLPRRDILDTEVIKNWVRRNPKDGRDLLYHNPSYVFFREVNQVPADKGPLGAMNRSVTDMRTVAVDPKFVPLGAPVWIEKEGALPLHRLMIAQDTGSAIKGAQRADIFFGTGEDAGRAAGKLRDPGRMMVLMPIQRAYALLPEPLL
jgi:membrane-bound lytic murein transglycosylase